MDRARRAIRHALGLCAAGPPPSARRSTTELGRRNAIDDSSQHGWTARACGRRLRRIVTPCCAGLSLDLTGLPPTPEEIDRFANDRAPDAYERAVDALLAKPAYGERWAAVWLDLARYGDSQGYIHDPPRTIWRWRDWVIQALNDNMPYDRFTIELLAGDLLSGATRAQSHRHRLPPQHDHQHRGRRKRRGVPLRRRRRSRQHDDAGLDGHDHRLRPVPQPQVRPVLPRRSITSSSRSSTTRRTSTREEPTLLNRRESAARPSSPSSSAGSPRPKQQLEEETRKVDAELPRGRRRSTARSCPRRLPRSSAVPPTSEAQAQIDALLAHHRSSSRPEWSPATPTVKRLRGRAGSGRDDDARS